jgi:hypothetical protein
MGGLLAEGWKVSISMRPRCMPDRGARLPDPAKEGFMAVRFGNSSIQWLTAPTRFVKKRRP